ncbi:MAG: apolipoprotein N-acyltransferase [Planctomycetota bacterium]|nr:apolipoprotein N-acyltransferase [Planctomycetota bacterium]
MSSVEPEPLAPLPRLGLLSCAWGLVFLAGPGILGGAPSPLGVAGVGLWAFHARRRGRRAFACEWLAAGVFFALQLSWIRFIWWPAVPFGGLVLGLTAALAGVLLRRLTRILSLPAATALAWTSLECLRTLIPPPLGLGWLRVGHFALDLPLLAGSARVWGVEGLTFVLAALAGGLAELAARRRLTRGPALWAVGPLLAGLALAVALPAPETRAGPRLLLVQPAIAQERKRSAPFEEVFRASLDLTHEGLERLEREGRPAPELVCWGETMLRTLLVGRELEDAAGQVHFDPWAQITDEGIPEFLAGLGRLESLLLRYITAERTGALPSETWFLTGAEVLVREGEWARRTNAVVLYDAAGRRVGRALKRHLVPGAESLMGLENSPLLRGFVHELAGYVPDLLAGRETGILTLGGESREWRIAASVCFDNAFEDVYTDPVRETAVDLHLVVSNEAWYRGSFELDQMVAFSRLLALSTGRSVVRVANSGISCAIDPSGRELARLTAAGTDRDVSGTLEVHPPVPADPEERPPYVFLQPYLAWVLVLAGLVGGLISFRNSAPPAA